MPYSRQVAIAGGFDPFHQGHLDHLRKAAALGDYLIVIVSSDADMIRKKGKANIPQKSRIEILDLICKGLGIQHIVIPTIDRDGTVAQTLRLVSPDIFAKGGDRTLFNMPDNEVQICKEVGCEIRYGIGDRLNASREMVL